MLLVVSTASIVALPASGSGGDRGAPSPGQSGPLLREIPRHAHGSLSYDEFYRLGPHSDTPMILTGIPASESPCFGLGPNQSEQLLLLLSQHCAGSIRLDRMAAWSERGGKKAFAQVPFQEFIASWRAGQRPDPAAPHGPIHGMEYPIMERCDWPLWADIRYPPFFSGDGALRAKAANVGYGENRLYPALSFSEPGFLTAGHVDQPNNEIWIAMCHGRKRVRAVSVSSVAEHWYEGARLSRFASGRLLRMSRGTPADLVLNLHFHSSPNLFDAAFLASELPLLPIFDGVVAGGEMLYLPTSCLHAVRTEERTVYVISNSVDMNGLIAPNPYQLPVKLDSCSQRCGHSNFSAAYGTTAALCRRVPGCEDLVGRLLDGRLHVPLVDGRGPVRDPGSHPEGAARILDVALQGYELMFETPAPISSWPSLVV